MNGTELALYLRDVSARFPSLPVLRDEPMSRHCSFRIGGPCDAMLLPSSAEEAEYAARLLHEAGERPVPMGNGTNLLVTDEPLRRVVIKFSDRFAGVRRSGLRLTAGPGITLARLATAAAAEGLTGLEFAHGIPGTLGGAVYMNAGAYGGEIKDVAAAVTYLDEDCRLQRAEDIAFSYRRSPWSDTGCVLLEAELVLAEGEPDAIRARMNELMERRRASQPLDMPSAGSTFRRPAQGYAAALIDQAGLKGTAVGGAQVSEKHAGFIVNRGGATFDDVLRLMDLVRERVFALSGIELEPEVRILRNGGKEQAWNF